MKTAAFALALPPPLARGGASWLCERGGGRGLATSRPRARVAAQTVGAGRGAARMSVVGEGDAVPAFGDAAVTGGGTVSAGELGFSIVAFYPRDGTSGCTCEMNDFTRLLPAIAAAGARVYGVSPDSLGSHDAFAAKEGIAFPLISDEDGAVISAFGVWKQHPMFGKVVDRSSFIVRDGKVVRAFRSVKSGGHADEVVQALGAL